MCLLVWEGIAHSRNNVCQGLGPSRKATGNSNKTHRKDILANGWFNLDNEIASFGPTRVKLGQLAARHQHKYKMKNRKKHVFQMCIGIGIPNKIQKTIRNVITFPWEKGLGSLLKMIPKKRYNTS